MRTSPTNSEVARVTLTSQVAEVKGVLREDKEKVKVCADILAIIRKDF